MKDETPSKEVFTAIGKQVLGLDSEEVPFEESVRVVDEVESLCMNCEENGTTRLLLTKIPFFREVILMSFSCDHCNFSNNEIQAASEIQEKGIKFSFRATELDDLQRQIVKSNTAVLKIEELDIETPSGKGQLTNIEGVITEVLTGLQCNQEERKQQDPILFQKLDKIIQSLQAYLTGSGLPFTITIDDPAGNSSIEPSPRDVSHSDKYLRSLYARSTDQNRTLGLADEINTSQDTNTEAVDSMQDVEILEGKTYDLPVECPGCTNPAHMLMQMVNIPHFKQVVLSTTQCDHCNYHTTDVKTGGEIPLKGKRIWLSVEDPKDLQRDILKSDTCLLKVEECKIEVVPGTMGGRFTTVEGILTQVRDDLRGSIFDAEAESKDSMPAEKKAGWDEFFDQLDRAINGEIKFQIMMEDPLANSFCEERTDLGESDPRLRSEEYERSEAEEEELGLADMKTQLNENGEYVKEEISKK